MPPKKANGTEVTANGRNSFHLKYPLRLYCKNAIPETNKFNSKAEDLKICGLKLKIVIIAKYPLAPP